MPETAVERGLLDPLDPDQALPKSAAFLRDLRSRFGNLGLAAAAYNAGPKRVQEWLAGRRPLPGETQDYVRSITGLPIEKWASAPPEAMKLGVLENPTLPSERQLPVPGAFQPAGIAASPKPAQSEAVDLPWGVQLVGDLSESKALAAYAEIQKKFRSVLGSRRALVIKTKLGGRGAQFWHRVRIATSTRESADRLCSRLRALGGSCIVQRN